MILSLTIYCLKYPNDSTVRLTAQFYLWKETLRYTVHPSIPLPHDARIADVATGNGYASMPL